VKFLRNVVIVLTATWFVFHFSATALYNMPANPLQTRLSPIYRGYMRHFFPQVWTLFAPNPIQSNQSLLLQCLDLLQKPLDQAWVDVLRPLWLHHEEHRLSAYDRLSRTFSNPMRDYLQGPYRSKKDSEQCLIGDKSACERFNKNVKKRREIALANLVRPASAYCADLAASQGRARYPRVAIRLRTVTPPSWEKRYTGKSVTADHEIGIQNTVDIQPIGLFQSLGVARVKTSNNLTASSHNTPEGSR
jgi:hypothetical protein